MITRRAMVGGAIIVAWIVGIGFLVRRVYFRPQLERLAEAAARVNPGVVYYGVMQGDRQVGFASSTVDTTASSIVVTDYLAADLPIGGKNRRTTARTNVTLTRGLRMTNFDISLSAEGPPIRAGGRVDGDSLLVFAMTSGNEKADSQRVAITGPILLPTLVPIAVALSQEPKVGKHYILPILDPTSLAPKDVGLDIKAESLFSVSDSAVFSPTAGQWKPVTPDTVRAWQVVAQSDGGFTGWIDAQGRIMETTQLGFTLRRLPYEVAFENWRNDTSHTVVTDDHDILETTAIAANKRMARRIDALTVRLTGVSLAGYDLDGGQQRLVGDTLIITRTPDSSMTFDRLIPYRDRDPANVQGEPMIQTSDPKIRERAGLIRGPDRNARVVAEKINTWVHDSISPRITFGVPSAAQVLRSRTGDCNEHTQLYVALARVVGLPARIAAGLAYVDGKFYYHAWPEVLLREWVAVDPTFGQFPADAAHIRFTIGGLSRQTELLRLMGNLKIDVLTVNGRK